MKPYYEDELVTLYHGRCEDVLPQLETSGSTHLLTDPPYFKVKDNDWDNQWSKAAHFLDWMGEWLDLAKPLVSADASVWVFASPELTSAVESVVAQRFKILNSIRWVKQGSMAHRMSVASARSHVSFWEGIVFAEMPGGETPLVSAPIGKYLAAERKRAGVTRSAVNSLFPSTSGKVTNALSNWELGYNMITEQQYAKVRELFGPGFLTRDYAELQAECAHLLEKHLATRRPFALKDRKMLGDIWDFASVPSYPGRHPCEKPQALIAHMIETTTRPGDTIIDCFAGSGAVLDAARQAGRRAIGIEMDRHWCEKAAARLSQQTFDLEGIA